MAKRSRHTLIMVAGAGVGAYALYEFVYKPWAASRTQGGAQGGTIPGGLYPSYPSFLPGPAQMVSAPGVIGFTSLGPQYGGVLGACIAKKGGTWTPQYCQARLDALVNAAKTAKAQIAALKAGSANPNAAGIPAAQAALAQSQAALTQATAAYNANVAQGDAAGAANWHAAVINHTNEVNDLTARISAAQMPLDNTAAIAAYEGALASNDNDYFTLTGQHLIGAI